MTKTDAWLADRLDHIWHSYFADVNQHNEVSIRFGRSSTRRLGSIGMLGWQDQYNLHRYLSNSQRRPGQSTITITGYFKDERVPEYVIDVTIAHELVHYAHGFHSPHRQLYRYPHKGGVVDQELRRRGLGDLLKQQQLWLKQEWSKISHILKRSRKRRYYGRLSFLPAY